jgi:hypothetical protein
MISLLIDLMLVLCLLVFIDLYTMLIILDFSVCLMVVILYFGEIHLLCFFGIMYFFCFCPIPLFVTIPYIDRTVHTVRCHSLVPDTIGICRRNSYFLLEQEEGQDVHHLLRCVKS